MRARSMYAPLLALLALALSVAVAGLVSGDADLAAMFRLVFIATAAVALAFPIVRVFRLDQRLVLILFPSRRDPEAANTTLVNAAEQSANRGENGLAELAAAAHDRLLGDGLRMVVARVEAARIRQVLEQRLDAALQRRSALRSAIGVVARAAPALGIIGLVACTTLLAAAVTAPAAAWGTLPAIAAAGVMLCLPLIVFAVPMQDSLARRDAMETLVGTMIIEGLAAIRDGEHPRAVERLLRRLLPPVEQPITSASAAA